MNILVQVTSINCAFLAYVTVGMMSLERLILFYDPNFYLRHVSSKLVKTIAYCVWLAATLLYLSLRFLVCFLQTEDFSLYHVTGKCNTISNNGYIAGIAVTIFIAILCYIKIFLIIKSDVKLSMRPNVSVKHYKATSAVFVYLVIIILTSAGYLLVIKLNLSQVALRFGLDIITTVNCILDPFVYVLWFKECRMEMLKMLSVCLPYVPSLERIIENMRKDIFHMT
ncbi:hypothetical protein DPMN_168509 [Dreissena polymorpha]|uniref:G-protein coupled receptors family 1 profile domain-containing protein n=1 Tax=Dreissena polymorpha TaxID=45954 RepID=A0A9D4IVZ9_DREPO|nr:hypothetical protein DPMN_168509 [Dreissena polymorpha]